MKKKGVLNAAGLGQSYAGGRGKFDWKIVTVQKAVNWLLFIQFSIEI